MTKEYEKEWYELFEISTKECEGTRTIEVFPTLIEAQEHAKWLINRGMYKEDELAIDKWGMDSNYVAPVQVEYFGVEG